MRFPSLGDAARIASRHLQRRHHSGSSFPRSRWHVIIWPWICASGMAHSSIGHIAAWEIPANLPGRCQLREWCELDPWARVLGTRHGLLRCFRSDEAESTDLKHFASRGAPRQSTIKTIHL